MSEQIEQPVLRTSRLILRPFVFEDALAVQLLAGAREVADTTLHIPHPYPSGAAEQWIATHSTAWDARTGVTYAVTDATNGVLLGATALTIAPAHARGELGYWIGVPYWNLGYCTEAARPVVDLGFRELGLHRVQARHLTRNPASGPRHAEAWHAPRGRQSTRDAEERSVRGSRAVRDPGGRVDDRDFGMKRPKGVLLDYGGTLVEEAGFDPRAGNAWLLAQASYVPPGVTLDAVLERARRVTHDVADRRDKLGIEAPWASLTRLIHDYFGVIFEVPFPELERGFWDASVTTYPIRGAREALDELARLRRADGACSATRRSAPM